MMRANGECWFRWIKFRIEWKLLYYVFIIPLIFKNNELYFLFYSLSCCPSFFKSKEDIVFIEILNTSYFNFQLMMKSI